MFAAPSESLIDLLKTSQLPNRAGASLGQKTYLNKTFNHTIVSYCIELVVLL